MLKGFTGSEFSSVTKKAANDNFIKSANNPYKAAWSVINVHRTRQVCMSCLCSPYVVNEYLRDVVEKVISSFVQKNQI